MEPTGQLPAWIEALSDEDRMFIKRFVLASGSLKDLATAYDVSYPTVRARLNRLIDKITMIESTPQESAFERSLRLLLADGRIDAAGFRELLAAYKQDRKENHVPQSTP